MNKTLIAILVILFAQGIYTQQCLKYNCNSTTVPFSNGNPQSCVNYQYNNGNSFNDLQTCLPGFACYLYNSGNTITSNTLNPSLGSTNSSNANSNQKCVLNGTSYMAPWTTPNNCYQNSDCATQNCTNGTCQYSAFNQTCSINLNCGIGMSCVGGTCQKILTSGSNCSTTSSSGNDTYLLCVSGTFCTTLNSSTQATCIQAFSVSINTTVNYNSSLYPSSSMNINFFCQSGYYGGNSGCAVAPITTGAQLPNMVCNTTAQCTANSTYNTANLNTYPGSYSFGQCNCNFANTNGNAFCSGNPGDQLYQQWFQAAQQQAQPLNNQMPNQAWAMCSVGYQNMSCTWSPPVTSPVYASSTPQLTNFSATSYTLVGDTTSNMNNILVCPIYQFANSGLIKNGTSSCMNTTSNSSNGNIYSINVQGCPSGYTCVSGSKTTASCYVMQYTLPSGNTCINNYDCQSNYCANLTSTAWGVCAFKPLNQTNDTCSSNLNCVSGQFCYASSNTCTGQTNCNSYTQGNNTCQPYIAIGGNCNSSTYAQCMPGSYCSSVNTNANTTAQQMCTRIFSYSSGQQFSIYNFTNNISNIDTSYQGWYNSMCQSGSFNMSTKQCNDALETTVGGWPKVCSSYTDCTGIYGQTGTCQCQPNNGGVSFCQGFFGDHVNTWNITKTQWTNLQNQAQTSFQNCYWYQTLPQNSQSNAQCGPQITALTTLQGNGYYSNYAGINLFSLQTPSNFSSSNYTTALTPTCLTSSIWQYQIFNPNYVTPVPVNNTPTTQPNNTNPNPGSNTQPAQTGPVGSATLIGTANSCPAYVCGSTQATFSSPTCLTTAAATSSNQQQIQSCYKGFGCYLQNIGTGQVSISAGTSPTVTGGSLSTGNCYLQNCAQPGYPGSTTNSQCYRNADCSTGYCANGACSTQALGASCTTQSCGAGLMCYSGTCQKILLSGQTCDSTTDSTSYQLCAPGSACVTIGGKGTCTLAFSVATSTTIGGFVGSAPTGWSTNTICASGYVVSNVCTAAPPTTGSPAFPLACNQASTCLADGVAGGIAGYGACACGYATTNGQAYCTGNPGDAIWKNAFSAANSAASALNQKVATTAYYMCGCPYATPVVCTWSPPTTVAYGPTSITLSCVSTTFSNLVGDTPITTGSTISCPSYNCGTTLASNSFMPNSISGIGATTTYNNLCVYQNPSNSSQYIFAPNQCPPTYTCFPTTTYTPSCPTQACAQTTTTNPTLPKWRNCTAKGQYQNLIQIGGQCLNNNDCITNYCASQNSSATSNFGTCQLTTNGATCTSNFQCPANTLCNSGTCTSYLAVGATCSQNNANLCPGNTQCVQQTGQTIFTCQKFLSIPAGKGFTTQTTFSASSSQNSGAMCESGSYNKTSQLCATALETTIGGWPKNCTSSSQCMSTLNNQANCICQPNTQGNMYCQGFLGDWVANWAPYKNAWSQLKSFASNGYSGCAWYQSRTEYSPNSCNQLDTNQNAINIMTGYLNGTWSIVPNNLIPSCYSSNFWNYKLIDPNTQDTTIVKVATMLFLAIFLMFIFI